MVFMRMGDDDAAQIVLFSLKIADIRQDEIGAGLFRPRKAHAHIHHQPLAIIRGTVTVHGQIHADFAHAAKRQKDEFRSIGSGHEISSMTIERSCRINWT
jgi:hypothetical protein